MARTRGRRWDDHLCQRLIADYEAGLDTETLRVRYGFACQKSVRDLISGLRARGYRITRRSRREAAPRASSPPSASTRYSIDTMPCPEGIRPEIHERVKQIAARAFAAVEAERAALAALVHVDHTRAQWTSGLRRHPRPPAQDEELEA